MLVDTLLSNVYLVVFFYKPNSGWIMAGITASFGFPAALGFDDYMYNR